MSFETLTVQVSPQAAEVYRTATADERRKLDLLISLKLVDAAQGEQSLEEVMQAMSRQAQERGLTPAALQAILDEQ